MKIPKKPVFTKKPYPTKQEWMAWENFVNLVISLVAIVISLAVYFLK